MASMQTTRPHNVYIVDDSEPIRARLVEMIGRLDHVKLVGEAATARDAIAGIRRTRPDSVLLDLNLMGVSGLEVLRAIHGESPAIAFVVLTNHSEPQYERACLRQGARYFLDKFTQFERVPAILDEISRH
jgi:DNA-binding NarL/FixJ family response regulator